MAQTALITLTIAGTDTGPFNLYSDVDGYITPFETNVPKAALESGFITVNIPDDAVAIKLQSNNARCDDFIYLAV